MLSCEMAGLLGHGELRIGWASILWPFVRVLLLLIILYRCLWALGKGWDHKEWGLDGFGLMFRLGLLGGSCLLSWFHSWLLLTGTYPSLLLQYIESSLSPHHRSRGLLQRGSSFTNGSLDTTV